MMQRDKGQIFMFSVIAAIMAWTIYKKFDAETQTFDKPILAILYGIILIMCLFFIVKNLVSKA